MIKRIFSLFILVTTTIVAAVAQTSREEVDAHPCVVVPTMTVYSGTNYTTADAVAPKGYEPFYITGYLRHGSRYESHAKYLTNARAYFREAEKHNLLTPLGKRVKEYMEMNAERQEKRIGDLTRIGYEQHLNIGRRFGKRFPSIFRDDATVASIASIRMRSTMSMVAFNEGLKEHNPRLHTDMVSSAAHGAIVRPQDPGMNPHLPAEVFRTYDDFVHKQIMAPLHRWGTTLNFDHAHRAMFTDPDKFFALFDRHPMAVLIDIYKRLAFDQNIRKGDRELVDLVFSAEERYNIYRIENCIWYYRCASAGYPIMARIMSESRVLFDHIVEQADKVVSGERHEVADLRFGHDYYLIPMATILGMDGLPLRLGKGKELHDNVEAVANRVAELWRGYKITPKAANVVLVFYRNKNKAGEVLVRVLLNERDVTLPLKSHTPHYYKWQDVKALIYSNLDEIDRLAKQ